MEDLAKDIVELPAFEDMPRDNILVIGLPGFARFSEKVIRDALLRNGQYVLGFDTETRPTFTQAKPIKAPHIVQLSTIGNAFIFRMDVPECVEAVKHLLEDPKIKKVGFGTKDDTKPLRANHQIVANNVVDLGRHSELKNGKNSMGLAGAVEKLLKRRMVRPKRITLSNWTRDPLTVAQMQYAANDAWASLLVYFAL